MAYQKSATITQRWLTLQQAAAYTGVHKRTLENWEKAGCFRVSRVIVPGHSKGRVLVCRESLDGFIERFLDDPPQDIPMNKRNREAAAAGAAR
jgi:excisionase family DNA binding protein